MNLKEFFNSPDNFIARERMLHMKASLEIKLHAAASGEIILISEPEIDRDGYDFVISLGNNHLHIQSKATLDSANVKHWEIHPNLLKPSFCDNDITQFDNSPVIGIHDGASGGVLLHVIDSNAASQGILEVKYFYTDIFFLIGIALGLHAAKNFTKEKAFELLQKIQNSEKKDRINIPHNAFLPIKSPASIIALRFHIPVAVNYISCLASASHEFEFAKELWDESVTPWIDPSS